MSLQKISTKILTLVLFASHLASCESSSTSGSYNVAPPHSPNIELGEISNAKCLDLEKYLDLLNSSLGNQPARRVSSGFEIKPIKQNHASKNFQLRLALGSFSFEDSTLSQLAELNSVTQQKCEEVTM